MPSNPKATEEKINAITNAWESLRSDKTFAKLSLAQFKTKVKPSLDARAEVKRLEAELSASINARDDADAVSSETITLVVNAVKGDPDEGEDGELYEAMGYVRKSERASGLTRRGNKKTDAPPK